MLNKIKEDEMFISQKKAYWDEFNNLIIMLEYLNRQLIAPVDTVYFCNYITLLDIQYAKKKFTRSKLIHIWIVLMHWILKFSLCTHLSWQTLAGKLKFKVITLKYS